MNLSLPAFLLTPSSPVPSPCFVIDAERLRDNAQILETVQERTGARILLALKGYAAFATFPLLSRAFEGPLYGTCASSVDEARLGREEFGGEVHAFAAAFDEQEMRELAGLADHITFNSLEQWRKLRPIVEEANRTRRNPIKCGFRINPEYSAAPAAIYDPSSPGSRLGIRKEEMQTATAADWEGISGLHFHTLCEQDADALAATLAAVKENFGQYLSRCSWLNWGGGHHITRKGYKLDLLIELINQWSREYKAQIYLEPGEAVALDAGWLVATVLDIVKADMKIAILDVSAACHMPDVLEMPYTPQVWRMDGDAPVRASLDGGRYIYRLAGKSCLAGDVIGEYGFATPIEVGERLAFADMAIYSMVKTTTFNGLRLPSIGLYDPKEYPPFRILRTFGYEDFKTRLS